MAPKADSNKFSERALTRRQLLYGFASVAASSVLAGCGGALVMPLSSSTGAQVAPSPPVPQPVPVGAITAASLVIGSAAGGWLDAGFLGLAYEKQSMLMPLLRAANVDLVGLFRRLGPGVLRVGGASVDQSVWTANGSGGKAGEVAPADVSGLAGFLRATGWSCLYGINLGGSATGATTPALAAAEVAAVAQQLGSALIGIELGNACEDYGSSFYAGNWSVEIFEALWLQYRAAIVAATPGARLAGPAAASRLDNWTLPFGEYVGSGQIELLTQQYTRGPVSSASVQDLVSPDAALAAELLTLQEGAQSIGVPFRVEAVSSYDGGGAAGVSDAYASALWAADTIFEAALAGASGIHFAAGGQQPDAVIKDSNGQVVGAQPGFYGLLLASMAETGAMLTTQLAVGALNVSAYAVQSESGGLSVVMVNKDATQNLEVSMVLPQAMSSATVQQMTQRSAGASAPNLAALSGVTVQGAGVAADGGFQPSAAYALAVSGTQTSCYVPSLSAVLVQLS